MTDDVSQCPAVSEHGVPCRKPLYAAKDGTYWEHAGGHIFMSDEVADILHSSVHLDATALLSGQPAKFHTPEQCTGEEFCSWRKLPEDRYK